MPAIAQPKKPPTQKPRKNPNKDQKNPSPKEHKPKVGAGHARDNGGRKITKAIGPIEFPG
jgi:hypothetical protein